MEDKDYRKEVGTIFQGMLKRLDVIDPDILEAELSQGTLVVVSKGKKTILSLQPPVKQIWLAVASEGIALHFTRSAKGEWMDDKGQGHELYAFTERVLSKLSGQSIHLK